jgi:iron complex outermembrane recepter protein
MKKRTRLLCRVLLAFFCLLCFIHSSIAQQNVRGEIIDDKGNPLPGATIQVTGTNKKTLSARDGHFSIDVPSPNAKLFVTNVGFRAQEVNVNGKSELTITMAELPSELNQIVVTGVFDKRKRMDASVAITTLNAEQLKTQMPASAADILKNVPGVYVNSSIGEIRNTVSTRGTPVSNTAAAGLQYVSLQEDGLPVTNVSGNNYGPDYFLRVDATIGRVEAVRGGSASITGSDAPGGLFNYVSKTGGKKFEGEIRLKYGIEGDGNPYGRLDLNIGGPLSKKGDWTYNLGGFYRYSNGARYAGYALNKGGQLKGNIVKKLKNGSLKLYGKYLNDRNGYFDLLPFQNFEHPTIAAGFQNTNTFAGPGNQAFDFKYFPDDKNRHFDPKDLIHSQDRAIGLEWQQNLGKGWSLTNNIKYSSKRSRWNSVQPLGIQSADNLLFYYLIGALGTFGTYNFTDLTTGQQVLTTMQTPNMGPGGQFLGFNFTVVDNKLPNSQIQSAPVLFQLGTALDNKANEVVDQLVINKRIGKSTFTIGSYFGHSDFDIVRGYGGSGFMTVENRPHPLGITATDFSGNTYQFTNSQGFVSTGSTFSGNKLYNNRFDVFFGQTSPLTPKLTLDYGFRLNNSQYKGSGYGAVQDATATAAGGYDNNTSTVYDNTVNQKSASWYYNYKFHDFAFSGALNYKFSDFESIYGRFSRGQKSPDLGYVTIPTSQSEADELVLEPIRVTQIEIGYKFQTNHVTGFVTPFYSAVSNLSSFSLGQETNQSTYYTPTVFSNQRTIGLELEGFYDINSQLSIRAVGTFQHSKSPVARTWDVGKPGRQDDIVIEKRNQAAELSPNVMATVTPAYKYKRFNTFLSWRYMGKRPANALKAFYLPGFSQFDLGLGYKLTAKLSANINVNNLFNSKGVMGWYAPGGFPNNLNVGGFTPEQRNANPNAIYGATTIQPRSYYLTVACNF